MSLNIYGKMLEVDLSAGKVVARDIEPEFARDFIGGMGFGSKILYDEVGVDVEPLSPENIVIFAAGPLTGTHTPCSGRTEITTRSPLTGIIGTGNTGGVWGVALRRAGFELIVVRNSAEKPVYLWIDDGAVEIRDAGHLWGKDTRATADILRHELSPSQGSGVSVLAIGPAGENLVRYACSLNDYDHVAGRCGAGAVMGVKKLKAIAVRGTGAIKVARPAEFQEAARVARERLMAASRALKMPGAPVEVRVSDLGRGCLPTRHFQSGIMPNWLETRSADVARQYFTRHEGTCYACPVSCFALAEVKEGKYAGLRVNRSNMPGVVLLWGAKCAIDNLPAIWKCKELCQKFGMDYESTGGTIAFAMELFQRGLLTKSDTNGLELTWSNEDAIIQMVQKIAFRDGFGDVLAEGSVRAAEIIGRGAKKYLMTVKGMEMAMLPDPRAGDRGWILGSLTNPRGGDNLKNTHFVADRYNPNWWTDKFDMFEDVKKAIYCMPPEEVSSTWEGKALMCRWFEDLYSAANIMGFCFFPIGIQLALGPNYISRLFSACTGWDTTPEEVVRMGEKALTLLKVYNVRLGLTRKDDDWPDKFYTEPMPDGPSRGAILSRDTMKKVLDEYYDSRGWDRETGLPTRGKLLELGLGEIADELVRMGRIP